MAMLQTKLGIYLFTFYSPEGGCSERSASHSLKIVATFLLLVLNILVVV